MAGDKRVFDGVTYVFGMDGDADPALLDPSVAAKAVNRSFRGAKNRTRPPMVHMPFIFTDPNDELIVRFGNVQGAVAYRKTLAGRVDCLVASIAGNIYRFTLVNQSFQVDLIFQGNNPRLMHAWFVQARDWLYIQNGLDNPIFWDGVIPSSARRSNWPTDPEMPVGTISCFAFGRVFVSDAFDQIAASDIIFGNGFNTTSNTQNFTENSYWAEGGSFGMPSNLGNITGMIVTNGQKQGNTYGQGVVLILGDDGAQTLDADIPRDAWKDSKMQSVTLTGQGCVAPQSVVNVNNKTLFRSDDGLSLYENLQSDQARQLSFGKFSQATNNFFSEDTPWLLRYCTSIYISNRLLTTVSPFIQQDGDRTHRYHRGIISLDLDRTAEKLTGSPLAWDGLWTGIRPTAMVAGKFGSVKRAFAFSFDADGENRIYELCASGLNDRIDGSMVKTKWHYVTKRFDWSAPQASNTFENKTIVGGEVHGSEIRDRVDIKVNFRADTRTDWYELLQEVECGPELQGFKFTDPRWKRYKFLSPSVKTKLGEEGPPDTGVQHQFMISGEGSIRIDRFRVAMAPGGNEQNIPVGSDPNKVDDPQFQLGGGVYENDYAYLIVPKP